MLSGNVTCQSGYADTYDHRTLKTRLPVRSALFKQRTGGLVVRWVTTSEYPLLYVFVFLPNCDYIVSFETGCHFNHLNALCFLYVRCKH
jgi:hypothetical protein